MNNEILKIGMPAGSLANAQRGGNLIELLEKSGFRTSGYDKGGPTKFSTVNYLYGWDGRPQEFGSQLEINEIDVAIAGDDWIRERMIELEKEYNVHVNLKRVMSLNRGGVKIVGIVNTEKFKTIEEFLLDVTSQKELLTIVSEMPYLALEWLQKKLEKIGLLDKFKNYSVQKYKTPSKIKSGILIYETWGKTEAKVRSGAADLGLEITQSGSAIKNYGLKIIDTVMESQTSIWIHPEIVKNKEKNELLNMFLLNLYGSIFAENKVMLLFNVPNEYVFEVEKYLIEKNLFADEPTVSKGKEYSEYNIQVDTDNSDEPFAKIRYELAKRGARNINTLPIQSSIPGLNVILSSTNGNQ